MNELLDQIIGHLGAAQVQHSASIDDDIIARHVADALTAAKALRRECKEQSEDRPTDAVVDAVRADLLRRSQIGIAKYGTTLEREDLSLRDWAQHTYEEMLDAANYLKRTIMELDRKADSGGTGAPGVVKGVTEIVEFYE